jgi:prolyl oligopeptidase
MRGRAGPVRPLASLASAVALTAFVPFASCDRRIGQPVTVTVEAADTVGDIVVNDPYRWLEDGGSEAVAKWVAEQNAWTDAVTGGLTERPMILRRIVELLRTEVATQPVVRGGRYFFMRRSVDERGFTIFMREDSSAVDRRLVDAHMFSDSLPPEISLLSVTADGGVVAYSVQRPGSQESEIRFFDVERRADLAVRLPRGRYTGAEMLADRSGVYYARIEEDGPRLRFRSLAAPAATDSIVFGEGLGPDRVIGSAVSATGRWLGIVVFHGEAGAATDVYIADLESGGTVRRVVEGIEASFLPTFAGDALVLQTDWNAPNGRVVRVPLADPRRERWVEIVPERADAVIEGLTAVGGRILVNTVRDAYSHIDAYDIDGTHLGAIELPFPGTVSSMTGGWVQTEAFFTYTTFHQPSTIERYDAVTGQVTRWFDPGVPIPSGLTVSRLEAVSADGTRVPVFVVHREGLAFDGRNPALITGFGGFGASMSPGFTVESVIAAERGGVFAVANVRGGGEFGEAWHEAAVREAKPLAIDDFIAAAELLIAERYTNASQLAAVGMTHGGMLVAAAMTRRLDLFGAVAAQFPPLDMARFTQGGPADRWIEEYGSPSDPAALSALLAYSPYHAVDPAQTYPPVLFVAGESSPIPPFHARKMTARLQATTLGGPFLLREDTLRAVAPGSSITALENLADLLAFVLGSTARDTVWGPRS